MPRKRGELHPSTPELDQSSSTAPDDGSVDFFVARQPIFETNGSVYGYELLFRSCSDNVFDGTEAMLASSHVISNVFFSVGAGRLLSGKKAFINFPRDLLVTEVPLLISPRVAVIEILETVKIDPEVLAACRHLKAKGYILALDDFSGQSNFDPLLDLADIIKVDFRAVHDRDRRLFVEEYRPRGVKMLAEKVETQEEFQSAASLGYTYFQGFFFARPKMLSGREIAGFKLNYVRILAEIHHPDLDYDEIGALLKQEISLASRLLRYINSAAFSWRGNISSLQQALALLGEKAIRHWVSVAALLALAKDKPGELAMHAIVRARFCESMSPWANLSVRQQPTLFLIGMFSLLDAILDCPLDELLTELPLSPDVRSILLGSATPGDRRADVFALVKAYEAADWKTLSATAGRLGIARDVIPQLYLQSLDWSARIFRLPSRED